MHRKTDQAWALRRPGGVCHSHAVLWVVRIAVLVVLGTLALWLG